MARAAAEPALPFLIEWAPGSPHPGRAAVAHPCGWARLERLDLSGSAEALRAWLGAGEVPERVSVAPGPPAVTAVRVATGAGGLDIRSLRA